MASEASLKNKLLINIHDQNVFSGYFSTTWNASRGLYRAQRLSVCLLIHTGKAHSY